jgi:rare lipoprotein A
MHFFAPIVILAICSLGSCCPGQSNYASVSKSSGGEHAGEVMRGQVSYYSNALSGRRTASGERYDPKKMTAANRSLPFGTRVKITRVDTGKSVIVRVNDRGPFGHRRRIFDVSRAAAEELGMVGKGLAQVEAVVLE